MVLVKCSQGACSLGMMVPRMMSGERGMSDSGKMVGSL